MTDPVRIAAIQMGCQLGEVAANMAQAESLLAEVAGLYRDLRLEAVIRSRVERSTQELKQNTPVVYGLEFIEADEDRRLLLAAYVYAKIAQDQLPTP